MPKNIYFFYKNYNGIFMHNNSSTGGVFMRTVHYVNEIKNQTDKLNVNLTNNIKNIKNSIIIFIKDSFIKNINQIKIAKENGNIIIVDIIDWVVQPAPIKNYDAPDLKINNYDRYVDGFICVNKYVQEKYEKKYGKKTYIIKHHYDDRLLTLKKNDNTQSKLNILFNGYIGHTKQNCLHLEKLNKNGLVTINPYFLKLKKITDSNLFNCHISIRDKDSWEFSHKPTIKVYTAASLNCNIITSRDIGVVEIFKIVNGEDYPYLLENSDYDSVIKMIKYAQKTYKTEIWYKGLEIMKRIKEHTSLESITKNYYIPNIKKMFSDFL